MCIVSIEWAHSYLKFKRYVINGCAVCCDPFFCAARCPYRFRSHSLLFFANTGVREGDVTRDNCPLCKHVQIWYLATLVAKRSRFIIVRFLAPTHYIPRTLSAPTKVHNNLNTRGRWK